MRSSPSSIWSSSVKWRPLEKHVISAWQLEGMAADGRRLGERGRTTPASAKRHDAEDFTAFPGSAREKLFGSASLLANTPTPDMLVGSAASLEEVLVSWLCRTASGRRPRDFARRAAPRHSVDRRNAGKRERYASQAFIWLSRYERLRECGAMTIVGAFRVSKYWLAKAQACLPDRLI